MNETERAIKHFEGLQKRYATQHNGKHCALVKTALVALREKQERDKGCECCQQGEEMAYQAKSKHIGSLEAYICLDGNILEADLFTDYMAVKINNCPMCGKKLEEHHETD